MILIGKAILDRQRSQFLFFSIDMNDQLKLASRSKANKFYIARHAFQDYVEGHIK